MKRLALMALGIAAATMAPALASEPAPPRSSAPSWCEQHAPTWAGADVGHRVGVFVGGDVTLDREVLSGYACYDIRYPGGEHNSELFTAWWDPEYGSAGMGCIRQAPAALVACKRNAAPLPFQGTTPITHENEPWWLHVLDVELDYRVSGGGIEATARVQERCAAGNCVGVRPHRVAADPDVSFRAGGQECRLESGLSCARTSAGDGVALGEGGGPTLSVDDLQVLVPPACVEVARDPRC